MSTETWKPVVGHAPYEVSDHGQVRNGKTGLVLAGGVTPKGYRVIRLQGESPATKTFHVMVAKAFIGPRPAGQQVRHLDGNKQNNRLENLAYGTNSENQLDSVQHGTHAQASRTTCPQGHPYSHVNNLGRRRCRICDQAADRRYQAKRRAKRREV